MHFPISFLPISKSTH